MKRLILGIMLLGLYSCADDLSCRQCEGVSGAGIIESEYCQDGPDVIETLEGVVNVIPNTTVEAEIAKQEMVDNVTCN